jgi:hypothetical protein
LKQDRVNRAKGARTEQDYARPRVKRASPAGVAAG